VLCHMVLPIAFLMLMRSGGVAGRVYMVLRTFPHRVLHKAALATGVRDVGVHVAHRNQPQNKVGVFRKVSFVVFQGSHVRGAAQCSRPRRHLIVVVVVVVVIRPASQFLIQLLRLRK